MSLNVWMNVSCFVCYVFVFCLFSYVCLCAPIKRPLIGVVACVRGFEPSVVEGACGGSNHRLDECERGEF